MLRGLALPAAIAAACAAFAAPAPAAAQAPAPAGLTPVGTGFSSPVYVTAPPGDGRRLMVVEQGGAVQVVRDGRQLGTPFLTLTDGFLGGGERGLLSIAFAPDYETSRLLYAYYTDTEGDIRVDELRRAAGTRDQVEPGYRRPVIEISHREAANHNGGQLQFGPDGYLYLATGDGGNGYDEPVRDARDISSLLGKLLRIDPAPGGGYTAPADNPYAGAGVAGADEVWSYGLRNPFRFSFDRQTGDLLIGDVGQSKVEEIDHAPATAGAGAGRGLDFGWDECEGSFQAEPKPTGTAPCPLAGDTPPVLEKLRPDSGFCSITGGYVVRDPGLQELNGRYVYGDLCYSSLRSFTPGAPGDDRQEAALGVTRLVSFGEDACGRLYTVEIGGTVSRVEDSTPSGCPARVPEPGAGFPPPGGEPDRGFPPPGGETDGALVVRLAGARRQRALRRGGVLLRVRCSRACGFRALAKLSLRRDGRPRRLGQAVRRLPAPGSARVKLKLSHVSRRAVRRALKRGRRLTATVFVRARGGDGRLQSVRLAVRLVR